jgi:hypothetical protein
VDVALAALIDIGAAWLSKLNPRTVSPALIARARERQLNRLAAFEQERAEMARAAAGASTTPDAVSAPAPPPKPKPKPKRKPGTVMLPPLPPLTFEVDEWTGRDTIPAWAGFVDVGDGFGPRRKSKGKVDVVVAAADEDEEAPPAPEQVAAYAYLKDNDAAVTKAVVAAIFKQYPKWRKDYDADEMEDDEDFEMPPIQSPGDLKRLIGLVTVRVLPIARDGSAYVGLDLACTWDDEHGLGVMTHKSRVIDVGQSDASFLEFKARKDGGRTLSAKPARGATGTSARRTKRTRA